MCRGCLDWLRAQTGKLEAIALAKAIGFVRHDDQSVFDLGLEPDIDPDANRAGCYLVVPVPDEWHAKLTALRYPVTELRNEDYGMREFTLTDPSGNQLRFGHAT